MTQKSISLNNSLAKLNEDWTSVLLGSITIILVLAGFKPQIPKTGWKDASELVTVVLSFANLLNVLFIYLILHGIIILGSFFSEKKWKDYLGFPVLFLLSFVAQVIAGNSVIKSYGLEAVIFSLLLGLAISNITGLPAWLKESISAELFTKIGLIILGASILFYDILQAGSLGLIQALAVVLSVWYFAYWLCKKLKIDDELTMMIASSVSICGVSAAIATSGAIKGDPKKLSYVISLVLIVAVPMMIALPYIANSLGLSQEVTGAWLGGTIDTTGAVVASGTLVGETALKISTIIKFSQNVLLGLAAFAISIYWTYRKDSTQANQKPDLKLIWERFPKFVIGFLAVSLVFSFLIPTDVTKASKDVLKGFQGLWFGLAFTSIGLETKFKDLLKLDNGKPVAAFLIAQTFNIFICLAIAYFLFNK